MTRAGALAMIAGFAAFALLPLTGSAYVLDLGIRAALTTVLAVSWNLAAGAGLISLGHAAFWGVGAYAGVLVISRTHSVPLAVLAAIVMALVVGLILGVVSVRMRRFYFAIATLAYAEALRVAAITFPGVTGGSVGLFVPPAALPGPRGLYYATLALAAASVALTAVLASRRPGVAFLALRDNEAVAMSIGVNPFRYRLLALALAAAPVGAAATLSATYTAFLDPDIAFDAAVSIEAQIAAIAGGIYTLTGPVLGALVVTGAAEVARQSFGAQSASLLVFGAVLVLLILFFPGGLVGGVAHVARRRRAARATAPVETTAISRGARR